jgi:serine/threonine-protein kinase
LNQPRLAIQDYTARLKLEPRNAPIYNLRAVVYYELRDYPAAIADHVTACELAPNDPAAFNHVAWIWATCPKPEYRNGPMAVEHATRACTLTRYEKAFCIDTLAAAYAACGRFDEAVKWAEKAIDLVDEEAKADYRKRLDLYRAGNAVVES